jgi:hypothetical protein
VISQPASPHSPRNSRVSDPPSLLLPFPSTDRSRGAPLGRAEEGDDGQGAEEGAELPPPQVRGQGVSSLSLSDSLLRLPPPRIRLDAPRPSAARRRSRPLTCASPSSSEKTPALLDGAPPPSRRPPSRSGAGLCIPQAMGRGSRARDSHTTRRGEGIFVLDPREPRRGEGQSGEGARRPAVAPHPPRLLPPCLPELNQTILILPPFRRRSFAAPRAAGAPC